MAEMFGAPLGERAYLDDARRGLATGVAAMEGLGRIAMQPDEARLLRAKADMGEMQLKEEKLWQNLMQVASSGQAPRGEFTGPPGPQAAEEQTLWNAAAGPTVAGDPIKRMEDLASLAMGQGLINKSLKILENTSQIRQRQASEASSRSTAALNAMKLLKEDAENMAQFFGGAKNQEELDAANALYQFQTGRPSPFARIPYDPQVIGQLNQRALSAKERFDLAEKQAHNLANETRQTQRLAQHDAAQRVREERLQLEREREARLRKQGEDRAAAGTGRRVEAKDSDIAQVKNLLRKDFPKLEDSPEVKAASYTIATEAAALLKANPALSRAAAINQAYTNARRDGDIEFEAGLSALGMETGIGQKFKFTGGGRSPATALAPPTDLKDLKSGRYYFNKQGQVGRWDGKQMIPVAE